MNVDLNNCLSAELAVPVCVMDVRHLAPPFVFRAGAPDEAYESLRGPFGLEGKSLLADALGPADMPRGTGVEERAAATLESMLLRAPVATMRAGGVTT